MDKQFKILRPFTSTGGVFFPIGLPPEGTCAYATKGCREYCYAENNSHYDFETNISQEDKWKIYEFFIKQPIGTVIERIEFELDGLQTPILHWFGTGECMMKDLKRILELINAVPDHIVQMGFTRNRQLWKNHKDIFALTVESIEEAKEEGMYSIPDYKEGISQMYSPMYNVKGGICGPYHCRDVADSRVSHFVNCQVCMELKVGCFDRRHT